MTLHSQAGPGRRYQVLGPVGRGGFGTVYRADMLGDDGFKRAVALKVLNPDVAETGEVARRFRDEARVLGLLRHRAIVQVDGLVYLGERQALVMEYIDGADLGRLMALGPVPAAPALEIVGEVANALDVAYQTPGPDGRPLGLLHRDVKPSNIRITPVGEVKVLDFGVARAEFGQREAVTKSYLLGSNGYMGPERFEGEDGPATDIYSLGVVLLEMVTGKFFGPTSIRPQKLAQRVSDALAGAGGVPEPLAELIRQMMTFEPSERPSAGEVERRAWDLRRTMDGDRLRDWAGPAVAEAASKKVPTPEDDLSGRVLTESGQGHTPVPPASPERPSEEPSGDVPDPGLVPAAPTGPVPAPLPPPSVAVAAPAPSLPDPDEWDDEQPTVVATETPAARTGTAAGSASPNLANLARSSAPSAGASGPVSDSGRFDRTPLPRPRPVVRPAPPPPPSTSNRTVWLGAALGAGAAVLMGALVVLSMAPPTEEGVQEPVDEQLTDPAPEASQFEGPSPTDTEGAVSLVGDVPAVRLVSVDGRRHPAGLLAPGTYLVSADFGEGAKAAGRFALAAGDRVTVDCSLAALACTVIRDE